MTLKRKSVKKVPKAVMTVYRFLHPEHFEYLLSQGMVVRWLPTWFLFKLLDKRRVEQYVE